MGKAFSTSVIFLSKSHNTQELCEANKGKWTTSAYEATHVNFHNSNIKDKIDYGKDTKIWYKISIYFR